MSPDDDAIPADDKTLAFEALRTVIDPELAVNIVDLGLIYGVDVSQPGQILVELTFSTAFCPLGDSIVIGVENVLKKALPHRVPHIQIVWEPRWTPERISEEGRRQLSK